MYKSPFVFPAVGKPTQLATSPNIFIEVPSAPATPCPPTGPVGPADPVAPVDPVDPV